MVPKFKCLQQFVKGELDGPSLMYHESGIMMRVVEQSKLVIFILHDFLICQKNGELEVGKVMQNIYVDCFIDKDWIPVAPAFSLEPRGKKAFD